jgi:acetyl-CoA acyltransferase
VAKRNPDWYWGMGLTAEAVAREYSVSRDDQDAFAFASHQKAIAAQQQDLFADQLVPIKITEHTVNEEGKRVTRESLFSKDEGPRADTSLEALAKLKPVFDVRGSVTAGNSSQTSDGAAFMLVMSEAMLKETGLQPVARLVHYAVAGVAPRIMGIGPVEAVPRVLKEAGWALSDVDLIELNEAFASQSIAVMRKLDMDPEKVNVNGGAIALGHPLGCSGAKLTIQLIHELKRRGQRRGMVTMCVGTGQGAAGLIELC